MYEKVCSNKKWNLEIINLSKSEAGGFKEVIFSVRRGADVGSDHHLVTAMVQLKLLRSRRTTGHRGRFDVSKLKQEATRKQFCTELR